MTLPSAAAPAGPALNTPVVVRTGQGGYRSEIEAAGHLMVADEPVSVGGSGDGPTPYDYLLAGLGACTGMTLRMYADRKGWPVEAVTVRLRHSRRHQADCVSCESPTSRIDVLEREIAIVGALDDDQRKRLLQIADQCPVHRTLESGFRIETRLAPG